MSMIRCSGCDLIFDSDADPDCFVDDPRYSLAGHPDIILCEWCREQTIGLDHLSWNEGPNERAS